MLGIPMIQPRESMKFKESQCVNVSDILLGGTKYTGKFEGGTDLGGRAEDNRKKQGKIKGGKTRGKV